jgi:pyruvate/2-oxoglutarate dehydrogenase complex dihydrolipoamide dehydrogenase (E3) component
MARLPAHILIVGGGVFGCELEIPVRDYDFITLSVTLRERANLADNIY